MQFQAPNWLPALRRIESLFFGGMRGEVWIEPGKPPSQARGSLSMLLSLFLFSALCQGIMSTAGRRDVMIVWSHDRHHFSCLSSGASAKQRTGMRVACARDRALG